MKKVMFFIIGLFVACLAEFWRFNLVLKQTAPWIPLLIGYFLFLVVAYFLIKPIKNILLYYIIFAIIGILMEIFWLGQLPLILASGIIGWLSWISFWGSVAVIPRLYVTKKLKKYTIIFFFCSLVLFLILQFATGFVGSMGLFYISLNIIYIWQFRVREK